MGRILSAASMLGNALKEDGASLTIRIDGGGPLGSIIAVSDSQGNVRGCVSNPYVDIPRKKSGKLDVGSAVGQNGLITVIKDIGLKEPYVGSTMLVSGEIAEDVTAYLAESEQVPSAVGLGVLVDTDQSVKAAGGFIVQLMPGADDETIEKLENNIKTAGTVTDNLAFGTIEELAEKVMAGFNYKIFAEEPVTYKCYCSRERVENALKSIGRGELMKMADEGKNSEVTCQFCDKVHTFTPEELRALANESAVEAE